MRSLIPANNGFPTTRKPGECFDCKSPIWRWNGREWVCYNCKLYRILHDHTAQDEDPDTLDGCLASVRVRQTLRTLSATMPDHACYHCLHVAWVYDKLMRNYRCTSCYPDRAVATTAREVLV